GAHHDPLFAFDDDDRVFGVGNGPEVRVQAHCLELPGLGERLALIEQCDVLQGLGVHGAPRAVMGKCSLHASDGDLKPQGYERCDASAPAPALRKLRTMRPLAVAITLWTVAARPAAAQVPYRVSAWD